jgi:hypothetical protein
MARNGWCAGRWIDATRRGPLATDGTGELPPAQRSNERSLRRLGVRARRGYGTYDGLPTWPRTTSQQGALGVPWHLQFADAVFKLDFLWIFKLKCTLQSIAKLKIKDPSTTIAKVGRGSIQGIEQEQHGKLAKISAPINSKPVP